MNFKDMLEKISQLSEATEKTKTGIKHTADAGGYGRKDDEDDEGKKVAVAVKKGRGRPKKNADSESGEEKKYDTKALGNVFGGGKAPKNAKKGTVVKGKAQSHAANKVDDGTDVEESKSKKKGLKEYFDSLDKALLEAQQVDEISLKHKINAYGRRAADAWEHGDMGNDEESDTAARKAEKTLGNIERKHGSKAAAHAVRKSDRETFGRAGMNPVKEAEQIQIKPASQMPKLPGQSSQPGQQQQVAGQPKKDTQVIAQGNKTLGTVDNPQLAQQIKQSIGKGEMTLMPDEEMAEDADYSAKKARAGKDIGKPGKNFSKIAASAGKKYGSKEAGKRVAGAILAKLRGHTNEAVSPVHDGDMGAGLGAGRDQDVLEGAKPDFIDLDKDGNKKESMKKAAQDKKKKVEEGINENLLAARLKGKHDGLKGHSHCGKSYDDMEEARMYHEGFMEGIDECYGQKPIEGFSVMDEMGMPAATVPGMADQAEVDEGNAFSAALARTPNGGKFKVGGKTFTDRSGYDATFESLDNQLNALLESKEEVAEGLTVSISKGQQGAPDSVSVNAQDGEADQLLQFIKQAGLGIFGGDEAPAHDSQSSPMSLQPAAGGPEAEIDVVGDHDGMMDLIKKVTGGAVGPQGGEITVDTGDNDYEDEEGHEEGHEEHEHTDEETCNECGMAYESCGCDHDDKEVVDEVESEDQMTYNVAEDNPPDSGAAEEEEEVQDTAQANEAGAAYDEAEEEKTVEESYANSDDDAFETDINFMTKVISGGLNKQKATGQTTIPVVAGQSDRMHSHDTTDVNESISDWKALAGIK